MPAIGTLLHIGLTGGIGSGKSTVGSLLRGLGATLVDTDRIARQLTEPGGAAIPAIRAAFGADAIGLSGAMDRVRMRAAAFADPAVKRSLEAILHPLIGDETAREAAAANSPVVVFDVPLLVESARWRGRVDEVWVVDCSEATQVARVAARAGWTPDAALAVIASQAGRALRRAAADALIDNDSIGIDVLAGKVESLWVQRTRGFA